uniref:Uncharacterized protein n=1 Tax=Rhizophora mucronata TaxID=61149 RepID=A0A2P2PIZ7_RHIMU
MRSALPGLKARFQSAPAAVSWTSATSEHANAMRGGTPPS